jgi:ribosome-associated translation inhibitor RaiA
MTRSRSDIRRKVQRQATERRHAFPTAIPKVQKTSIGRSTTAETPLRIRLRGVTLDDRTREYIHTRTGFKLGKFALRITRIGVLLEDAAGPKGAPAYVCRFTVTLRKADPLVHQATAKTPVAAFDVAVDGTERIVRNHVKQSRTPRKQS